MPLSSLLQRLRGVSRSVKSDAESRPLSASDVEATRVRARRRLIGMVVLVGAGILGFPWLFETQPRPMSESVQMVRAGEPIAPDASSRAVAGKVSLAEESAVRAPQVTAPDEVEEVITTAPVVERKPEPPVVKKVEPKAEPKQPVKVEPKPAAKPEVDVKPKATDPEGTRFVVQFGAFSDGITAHEARMKVERLGIKTYTQEVKTADGVRIRVRMGPYTSRADAEKVLASMKKAGLNGAVLTL